MNTNAMTQERLDAIRERLADATPGPWVWLGEAELASPTIPEPEDEDDYQHITNEDGQIDSSDDADLIEHAPDDLADLLAEVERLRELTTVDEDMVERAALASWSTAIGEVGQGVLDGAGPGVRVTWDEVHPDTKESWRREARAVLEAALGTGEGS